MSVQVVHVISGLAVGGAETNLRNLLFALRSSQSTSLPTWTHTVVDLGAGGPIAEDLVAQGVDVYSVGREPGGWFGLRRWVQDRAPALLHGWMYRGNLAASGLRAVLKPSALLPRDHGPSRLPVVWSVRHSLQDWHGEPAATRALVRLGGSGVYRPSAVTYNGVAAKDTHHARGYRRFPSVLVPNALDTERFRPDAAAGRRFCEAHGMQTRVPLIGLIGRDHPIKNIPLFVRMAQTLVQRGVAAQFLLAGRGLDSQNSSLTAQLAAAGVADRFTLVGELADVAPAIQALDLLVSTSHSEATSNVLLEASACGCAALATDVGEAARLIGARFVVASENTGARPAHAELADRAELLLTDPTLRCRVAAENRQSVLREHGASCCAEVHAHLYQALLQGSLPDQGGGDE